MVEREVYECLSQDEELAGLLAQYESGPAIFYQLVPADSDEGWDGIQYPRILFDIDTETNPERKNAGVLMITIACRSNSDVQPEPIVKRILQLIDGCFFTTTDGYTAAASWQRTDGFRTDTQRLESQPLQDYIFGSEMTFDLLDFPQQIMAGMDPLALMNTWTKEKRPSAKVINLDSLDSIWRPTDDMPAIYWRLASVSNDAQMMRYDTNMVTWMRAVMQCHVLAPSTGTRTNIIKGIAEALYQARQLPFPDKSPLLIQQIAGNTGASPLRVGQLTLNGTYGVLRKLEGTPIININISQGGL